MAERAGIFRYGIWRKVQPIGLDDRMKEVRRGRLDVIVAYKLRFRLFPGRNNGTRDSAQAKDQSAPTRVWNKSLC